jgi:hypothetical protein
VSLQKCAACAGFLRGVTKTQAAQVLGASRVARLLLLAAVMLQVSWASAAPTRVVLLVNESSAAGLQTQIRPALEGQLQELDVRVIEQPSTTPELATSARQAPLIAAASSALAVVWLDERAPGVVVYFYDAVGHHLYGRQVDASGSPTSMAEEIAIVLRSAVGAVLEGSVIAMTEVPLPAQELGEPTKPAPRAPPPARDTPRQARLWLGGSYQGTLFASAAPLQHGARAALTLSLPSSPWYFGLGYTYFPRLHLVARGVRVRLDRHPGELVAGVELPVASAYALVEGAVIGDRLVRSATADDAELVATSPSARWLWAISARLGGSLAVTDRVRLRANVGVELVLNRFDQVIADSAGDTTVVSSPLLPRPRFELGLTFAL